jgi:hypothetical protein
MLNFSTKVRFLIKEIIVNLMNYVVFCLEKGIYVDSANFLFTTGNNINCFCGE